MKMHSLYDLYLAELHQLYDVEHQIQRAMPKMMEKASSEELRSAFRNHLDQTGLEINRLESVFDMHTEKPGSQKCDGMEGIIREGRDLLKADVDPIVRDAALISAAQRIEHYEIAVYGCVRTYAEQLGFDRAARILQETLSEEEEMDRTLTSLAKSRINVEAAQRAR